MSIKLMSAVWDIEDAELKDARLLALLSLADHANDEGHCWPSIPRLAKRSRVSDRQIQRVLQWLIVAGYVEVLSKGNGRGHVTQYQLHIKGDMVTPIPAIKGDMVTPNRRKIKGDIGSIKGDIGSIKGDIGDENYSHARREPSIEPSIEPPVMGEVAHRRSPTPRLLAMHPALDMFYKRFKVKLNAIQENAITDTVTDLDHWRKVLESGAMRGYNPGDMERQMEWYRYGVPDKRSGMGRSGASDVGSIRWEDMLRNDHLVPPNPEDMRPTWEKE